jgi:multiple sugar transport system substrate-binding protein
MGLSVSHVLQSRYRVVSLLGQGGMGAVYRAWDLRLNIPVALKEMIPQPGLAPEALAQLRLQFEQEASVLARLNHPHLVRVIDFFDEGGNSYLVMDFVEGESLASRMMREGPLPEAQVLAWAGQLLDALDFCHQQGVLHRDIKPQNVIIRPDERAVLVDFGLVKLWDPSDPRTKTAMRGMGTPEYAPPEQYETAAGHTTPASDIYSLGATLYHALTGEAPPTATLRMADPTLYTPLREMVPHVSTETETAIEKAMDLVRAQRWESAQAMAAALDIPTAPMRAPTSPPTITPRRQPTKVMADAQAAAVTARKPITRRQFLYGALIAGGAIVGCGGAAAIGALLASNGRPQSRAGTTQTPKPAVGEEPTPTTRPTAERAATPEPQPTPEPIMEPAVVRWFIGLGGGTGDEHIRVEKAWVADFNTRHDGIEIELEIVPYEEAYDTVMARIAAGDAPDVCGPVGVLGAGEFHGRWLGLEDYLDPFIKAYDLTDIHHSVLDAWKSPEHGLIGLPVNAHPSALYVNRERFDEAGMAYPPQAYGAAYQGSEWDIDVLQDVAMMLTLDTKGRDAYNSRFDPENIIHYGYHFQWSDILGIATLFGAGSLADARGNAHCPDHWREAFHWYHDAMWLYHFIPNGPALGSDLLAGGNAFDSRNVAMAHSHMWYTCCLSNVPNWDYGIVPSYAGRVTAKLHADAIGVLNTTSLPGEAVEAACAIATNPELIGLWGGMPALQSMQGDYLARLDEQFPQGVHWPTILEGLEFTDVPNHESWMPNGREARGRVALFQGDLEHDAGLNVDAAIDRLVEDLQGIFEAG